MAKFLSSTGILTKVKAKQTNNLLFESNWNDVQLKFGVIEEHSALIVAVDDSDSTLVSKRFSVYTVETNVEKRDIASTPAPHAVDDTNEADGWSSNIESSDISQTDPNTITVVATQDPKEGLGHYTNVEAGPKDPAEGYYNHEVALQDPQAADGFSTSEVALQDPQSADGFSTSEVALQDPQAADGFSTSEVALQDPRESDGFHTSEVALQDPRESDGFHTSEVALQDPRESDGFHTSEVALQDTNEALGFNTSEVALQDTKEAFGFHTSVAEDDRILNKSLITGKAVLSTDDDSVYQKQIYLDKSHEDIFTKKTFSIETTKDFGLLGTRNINYDRREDINANRLNAFNTSIEKSVIRTTQHFKGYDVGQIDVNYSYLKSESKVIRILHDFQAPKAFEVNVAPSYISEEYASFNVNEFFVEIPTNNRNNFVPAQTKFESTETVITYAKETPDNKYNLIKEPVVNIKDVVRDVVNTNYYDVLKEVSPTTSFQKNAVEYVGIRIRKDWRRSPFYSDYHARHIIPNTNYELFNGIGQIFNPFSIVFEQTPRIYKSNFFDSPTTGRTEHQIWLRYVTKSYDISKNRLHGRPYEHIHDTGTEQEKWTSGRTHYDNSITGKDSYRWKGSNAFGHVLPKSLDRMTPYEDVKAQYMVQRKHYHNAYVEEYQTVNGVMPGYVVEFENVEHNLTGKKNAITKWEELWHPDWTLEKINWKFNITFGRLPNCMVFDGYNYISGLITDYDRFLLTYKDEDWFEYYGMVVDENYKDFDIAPVTEGFPENPDEDDPRKHTLQFNGFYPRQNYTKKVHLSFFILNNWTYDRDRFLLHHEEQLFFKGERVTGQEYIDKMKEIGFFEYNPASNTGSINTNTNWSHKSLIHEVIEPEKQMIGCTLGNTVDERNTIKKLFWADGYTIPPQAAVFRSCCPVDNVSGGN